MDALRHKRLEEELRDLIAALVLGGEVKDPRVGPFLSVTRVEAARDFSAAKVYVSGFSAAAVNAETMVDAAAEALKLEQAVEGLQHAAGFIQSRLGRRIRLRLTPRLRFVADHGIKEGFELGERIKGLFA